MEDNNEVVTEEHPNYNMDKMVARLKKSGSLGGYIWNYLNEHSLLRREFMLKELTPGEINLFEVSTENEAANVDVKGEDLEFSQGVTKHYPAEFIISIELKDKKVQYFDREEKGFKEIAEECCDKENRILLLIKEKFPNYTKGCISSRIPPSVFNKETEDKKVIGEILSVIVFK